MEEKIVALSAYQMAKGLCRKCGENGIEATNVLSLFN
jgi:ribosomal protein L40E